jgi:hypothetical protein
MGDTIKMDLKHDLRVWTVMNSCEHGGKTYDFITGRGGGGVLDQVSDFQFLKRQLVPRRKF